MRSPHGARRLALGMFALLLAALLLFPGQSQGLLDYLDGPVGQLVRLPLEAVSSLDEGISSLWQQYVSLQHVAEENRRLKQEMDWLRGENHQSYFCRRKLGQPHEFLRQVRDECGYLKIESKLIPLKFQKYECRARGG